MLRLATLFALAGAALFTGLIIREGGGDVLAAFAAAGAGILWTSLLHLLPMMLNARAWQVLVRRGRRPSLFVFWWLAWLREAINTLLPVAKIGGEVVSIRLLGRQRLHRSVGVASVVVDMTVTIAGQFLFTILGLGLLAVTAAGDALVWPVALSLLATVPLIAIMLLVQRKGLFSLLSRIVTAVAGDRFAGFAGGPFAGGPGRIDQAIALCYRRWPGLLVSLGWQFAGCLAGALEIWVALHCLDTPLSFRDAVLIEALVQAIGSAAFMVPGAIGVQEGGFVLIGAAVGLPAETALALALMRRARDLLLFVPALILWQAMEGGRALRRAPQAAE